jgi:hypothetical protein
MMYRRDFPRNRSMPRSCLWRIARQFFVPSSPSSPPPRRGRCHTTPTPHAGRGFCVVCQCVGSVPASGASGGTAPTIATIAARIAGGSVGHRSIRSTRASSRTGLLTRLQHPPPESAFSGSSGPFVAGFEIRLGLRVHGGSNPPLSASLRPRCSEHCVCSGLRATGFLL